MSKNKDQTDEEYMNAIFADSRFPQGLFGSSHGKNLRSADLVALAQYLKEKPRVLRKVKK